jgi:hypothetical protein
VSCLQSPLAPTQAQRSIQILTKSHLLELICIQQVHKDNLEKLKFQQIYKLKFVSFSVKTNILIVIFVIL